MRVLKTFAILLVIPALSFAGNRSWKIQSPDNKISMTIKQDSIKKTLSYNVDILSNTHVNIVEKSTLGIERKDQKFVDNLEFLNQSEMKIIDDTYSM